MTDTFRYGAAVGSLGTLFVIAVLTDLGMLEPLMFGALALPSFVVIGEHALPRVIAIERKDE